MIVMSEVLSCWILSCGGTTLFSYTKENQDDIDDQLFGGAFSALSFCGQSLGTAIHRIDFDETVLISFEIENLRIVIMLKKPVEPEEIEYYRDYLLLLQKRYPEQFKEDLTYQLEEEFEKELMIFLKTQSDEKIAETKKISLKNLFRKKK